MQRRPLLFAAVAASVGLPVTRLHAQPRPWPSRPVTITVMFPAGGVADIIARSAGADLAEAFGQPFIIENRPGANGQIAAEHVARSAADGHSLLLGSDALTSLNPLIYARLRYDPVKDFAPVTQLVRGIKALLVNSSVPASDVAQLIAYAKSNPGKLNYASFGIGSNPHLDGEMFKALTNTSLTHVPYKGVAEAVPALVAGDVHVLFSALGQAAPHIRAGRLKALAVFSAQRQSTMPALKTAAEQGLSGIAGGAWFGLLAPAAVPREVIDRLASACAGAIGKEAFRSRVIEGLGMEPMGTDPEQFARNLEAERRLYAAMVKAAGIEPQ
ncbi:tripartite tricarboxylate transporter substrate binding protein [Ramlibacter sp. AW1]|uniref:Tripartite tricarboxylate transporter substrate binding protein n=1 Tax=Ramlibacter aurantiacus TaxID=2801330 RepID=A0A936ZKH2_9BURK|nr:tripartite tricarboxylate transporter substrate binding protein [Ramlibacter aurantiacus]MBL0421472.1 tripartite tricarboxylate transporter substrate binding protein [Ramlibacter aurantiacus]